MLVAPVRGAASAVEDPQVVELALIDELDGVRLARTPLSQFGAGALPPAQRLGEDSAPVLDECLRLAAGELESLIAARVVGTAARPSRESRGDQIAAAGASASPG